MSDSRPAIPAELKRRVLVEAGHRCAIPTCRHIQVEVHHIVPFKDCGKHEYENLIALCPNCHSRADKGEIDRKALRIYKANLRYTHDKFSQFEVDMLFDAYKLPENQALPILPVLMRLVKRLLEAEYVCVRKKTTVSVKSDGLQTNPDFLTITDKGREYVDSLGLDEH